MWMVQTLVVSESDLPIVDHQAQTCIWMLWHDDIAVQTAHLTFEWPWIFICWFETVAQQWMYWLFFCVYNTIGRVNSYELKQNVYWKVDNVMCLMWQQTSVFMWLHDQNSHSYNALIL